MTILSPIDAVRGESATVTPAIRVLTKKFGGLLGPEYLIGYGTRYFRCGELSLSQLKRGISPDELCMLEIEDPDEPGWDD